MVTLRTNLFTTLQLLGMLCNISLPRTLAQSDDSTTLCQSFVTAVEANTHAKSCMSNDLRIILATNCVKLWRKLAARTQSIPVWPRLLINSSLDFAGDGSRWKQLLWLFLPVRTSYPTLEAGKLLANRRNTILMIDAVNFWCLDAETKDISEPC